MCFFTCLVSFDSESLYIYIYHVSAQYYIILLVLAGAIDLCSHILGTLLKIFSVKGRLDKLQNAGFPKLIVMLL